MADYYYTEMLFDPDEARFADVVEGVVGVLLAYGCTFRRINVPGSMAEAGLHELRELCEQAVSEGLRESRRVISFPPGWGRIMFRYDFAIDGFLSEEVWDEEDDIGAKVNDIGLSFTFSPTSEQERYIKMTLSFWEDFVLRGGERRTHLRNMRRLVGLVEALSVSVSPYFGVMNEELHTNPDRSLSPLMDGALPVGNEYVFVGPRLIDKLSIRDLDSSGRRYKVLRDNSVLIEFTDRFRPSSAFDPE